MFHKRTSKMNKLIILLFSIGLTGCCNRPKLLDNGLTQKATKVTKYTIKVEKDYPKNKVQDTLLIVDKIYDENDQIISREQYNPNTNENMSIEYVYDENKKSKKNIIRLLSNGNITNTFILNHYHSYKDTLLIETKSESKDDFIYTKQTQKYQYSTDNTLEQSSLSMQYITVESNDTVLNTMEVNKYNDHKLVVESKFFDLINPNKNKTIKNEYDCGILRKTREYNNNDSLIAETKYKYEFDKFENWIKKESFRNNKPDYIEIREIEYR